MKRGEVVDAETAAKIAGANTGFRAVIWPDRLFQQALKACTKIDLSARPCVRHLTHLWCRPDFVVIYNVNPLYVPMPSIAADMYGLVVQTNKCDYMYESLGSVSANVYVETEEEKQNLETLVKWKYKSTNPKGHVSTIAVETALDLVNDPLALDPLRISSGMSLTPLLIAIALEQFGFSSRTVFKQRLPTKQTTNRNPSLKRYPPIEIINLRLPEKKESPESKGQKLMVQIYVSGHPRWQWYPSLQEHKLIWIPEHTRGPKDAPLKPKPTKVYKVTR